MSQNFELLRASKSDRELFLPDLPDKPNEDQRKADLHSGGNQTRREILKLIERVFLVEGRNRPHMVAFSAMGPGDGSSRICAYAGMDLAARVEKKICLLDANPGSCSLSHYFDVASSDQLKKGPDRQIPQEFLNPVVNKNNLWIQSEAHDYPTGSGSGKPENLKPYLLELYSQFEFILLNIPPLNDSASAAMLAKITDGVILVLTAHSTRRAAALRVKQYLDSMNIPILGVVLSERTYPIPEWIYRRL